MTSAHNFHALQWDMLRVYGAVCCIGSYWDRLKCKNPGKAAPKFSFKSLVMVKRSRRQLFTIKLFFFSVYCLSNFFQPRGDLEQNRL